MSGQILQTIRCSGSGNKRLSALAISAGGDQIGVAFSRIGIYNVESGEQTCKLAGHQKGTKEIRFLESNSFALSIGNSERTIALWRIESKGNRSKCQGGQALFSYSHDPSSEYTALPCLTCAGESRKQLSSHRTITLDYPVASVASSDNHIVAICDNFQAFYFKLSNDGELLQEPTPIVVNEKVLAAVIFSETAVIATGAASSPSFERVPIGKRTHVKETQLRPVVVSGRPNPPFSLSPEVQVN